MAPSSKVIRYARHVDRHFFDAVTNWKQLSTNPSQVLPGYINYKGVYKALNSNFRQYNVYYTEAYVGTNIERGMGIRVVATTQSGQNIDTFYELSTSARNGTRWMSMNKATKGILAIKNSNLIGTLGENKFWRLFEQDRKIKLSLPTSGRRAADTVELVLHKDARLMRLEYQGDGNGLDIITKVGVPPPPYDEWMWLILEIKTSAAHNLDINGFTSVNRAMSELQKQGLKPVKKHVDDALRLYKGGNPYNLSVEDVKDLKELQKALTVTGSKGEIPNVAGLFIIQGLDETFEYAKNAKHPDGMRIVKDWINGSVLLTK